jgi:antitoxin component YwqK of YwqJK toxin-antitoxin module
LRLERDREALEKKKQADELKQKREQIVKDSTAFFISSKEQQEDGSTLEYIPDPINGTRQQIISRSGKVIQITTEYYVKTSGVQTIRRTYYKNGRIEEEFIYEAQIWHYRKYDKRGKLIEEKLNQSSTRT